MMANTQMTHHDALSYLRQVIQPNAKFVADTRILVEGDVFLAYSVGHGKALRDGRIYIPQALSQGAAYVLYQPHIDKTNLAIWESELDERCIAVPDLPKYAGWIGSEWYGNPSATIPVIGVTGTNGKTSVTQWLAQSLSERAAVIGTLGSGFVNQLQGLGYTTPDAPRLQMEFANLRQQGAQYIALEVSSHALEQGRVNGTHFACAIFTNLSRDHLDYHGSMAEYGASKARLFSDFHPKNVVINIDDPFGRELLMKMATREDTLIWAYGMNQRSFVGLEKLQHRFKSIYFNRFMFVNNAYQCELRIDGMNHLATVPVLGTFNLSNALAVISTLMIFGISIPDALERASKLRPVLGRMEIIHSDRNDTPLMVVDYAHTPDALQKVLETLKLITQERGGKLVCVFGCGGDRDQEKRPMMGAIAQKYADHVIVTSDNPRSEDPQHIMEMIVAGMSHDYRRSVELINDRAAAIMTAVRNSQNRDVVLVAGKGHETMQEIKGKRFDFSDQSHLRLVGGGSI